MAANQYRRTDQYDGSGAGEEVHHLEIVFTHPDCGLHHEQVYLINKTAAELAKKCTKAYMEAHPGTVKFVSGAIGPTSKTLSVSPSVENPAFRGCTYDEIEEAYYAQVRSCRAPLVSM